MANYNGVDNMRAMAGLSGGLCFVRGLRIAMRNAKVLNRIDDILGSYTRPHKTALQQKAPVQRIRLVHDVKRHALGWRSFSFSPELIMDLELEFEKCMGLCRACGFFEHGGGGCDKALVVVLETTYAEAV
ncbi:hypothetical protein ACLB2K_009733 [Fragaria x ananassa]